MRVRNKPWAPELIEAHPEKIVEKGQAFKGQWNQRFEKEQPIFIEVGTGKGQFIINMAKKYPQYNFIGIEIQKNCNCHCFKKCFGGRNSQFAILIC